MIDLHALHPQGSQPGDELFRIPVSQPVLEGMGQRDKGFVVQKDAEHVLRGKMLLERAVAPAVPEILLEYLIQGGSGPPGEQSPGHMSPGDHSAGIAAGELFLGECDPVTGKTGEHLFIAPVPPGSHIL